MALVIETSMETGSVALVTPEKILFERSFFAGRKPSSALWEPLEAAFAAAGDLAAVVVGTGPGSYNGVRIAIAAAQGIALVQGCPAIGMSSFAGVPLETSRALAIGDARRGAFSLQPLIDGERSEEVRLGTQDEMIAEIRKALELSEEVFCFEPPARFPLPPELLGKLVQKQSEAGLLGFAYWRLSVEERDRRANLPLEPIYLRPPHITLSKRRSLLDVSD